MQSLRKFWNTELISTSSGTSVAVGDVILVLLLILLSYLFSRLIGALLERRLTASKMSVDAIYVVKRVTFYLIFILVGLTALTILGIPITVFAFATGAIAIGVGFGAQNIINNFISGWILIAERPIRADDFIEIDNAMGTVQRVGTRSTLIHRTDGVHMLVPNSKLLENTVTNWTLVDSLIRTTVRVGVAYGSDPRNVASLFRHAVEAQAEVLDEPAVEIIFEDFGDNALIFDSYFWCSVRGEKSMRLIRSEIRFRLAQLFNENDIEIAFPQRDIHLHAAAPIPVNLRSSDT